MTKQSNFKYDQVVQFYFANYKDETIPSKDKIDKFLTLNFFGLNIVY